MYPRPPLFLSALCGALLTSFLLSAPARALNSDSAWVIPRESRYLEWQLGYGLSQEEGQTYQEFRFRNHLELGFLQNANIVLEYPFLTRSLQRSGQTPEYLINNGFTDFYLGSRVQLPWRTEPFSLAVQGGAQFPTGYNVQFQPVLGNGQLNLDLGLTGGWDFFPLEAYAQAGIGYCYRNLFPKDHVLVRLHAGDENPIEKPANQMRFFAESGIWLSDQLFAALKLEANLGLPEDQALVQSQVSLKPLLAWRLNPSLDLSLESEHTLWNLNTPALNQVLVGLHLRYGLPLERSKGLRGGRPDYATFDPSLP